VPDVVVAGHLCLDIIPRFVSDSELRPGKLVEVGQAELSTGGAVSNVGRALYRLGVDVALVGRIGDDPFGGIVRQLISDEALELTERLVVAHEGVTSYSVVLNPPGVDRTFLHMPGENDHFSAVDLPDLGGVKLFHFGYPPLMAGMFADEGRGLEAVLLKAKESGCLVSLDMSLPDPVSPSGKAPWRRILTRVLPLVDLFFPSHEELSIMLQPSQGSSVSDPGGLADECLSLGAGCVVVKCGENGLVARSKGLVFGDQSRSQPCFEVQVVGTTGAGDATIAGFIAGLLQGYDLAGCLRAGCAVGACCVQAPDALSGIVSWDQALQVI
jgi:sugar/nucleoside kinase (ribokinase family)